MDAPVRPEAGPPALSQRKEQDHKKLGNAAYKAGNFHIAIDHYTIASEHLTDLADAATLLANCAAAFNALKDYEQGLAMAEAALQRDPSNLKAIYRRAQALEGLGQLAEALDVFEFGQLCEPTSTQMQDGCLRVREAMWLKPMWTQTMKWPPDLLDAAQKYGEYMELPESRRALAKNKRPATVT